MSLFDYGIVAYLIFTNHMQRLHPLALVTCAPLGSVHRVLPSVSRLTAVPPRRQCAVSTEVSIFCL
jgi:hypothetical protein